MTPAAGEAIRLRIVAGNITSGNGQSYDPGEGTRIFRGLSLDVAMIQEFNYGHNSPADIREWVDAAFEPEYQYFREPDSQTKSYPS